MSAIQMTCSACPTTRPPWTGRLHRNRRRRRLRRRRAHFMTMAMARDENQYGQAHII